MTPTPHGQVPEALQLADEISKAGAFPAYPRAPYEAAAAELRRLHAQVAALTAAPQGVAYAELPEPTPDELRAIARKARDSSGSASDDCGSAAYVLYGWRAAIRATHGQAPATQQAGEVSESIEQLAVARYKVVPAHESMFHRWAVVAGDGAQQLYIGRKVECENMTRKFAGAFLDGAFLALQNATPQPSPTAQAAESVTAPAATPTAASIAWTALRDLTDPLGEAGVKIMGHVRIYAQRQYEAGKEEADRAARAPADSVTAPAGGVVDGWKLAPKEPTLHMGWAYLDAARESDPLRTHTFNHAGYRAMLAAAPTPPAQPNPLRAALLKCIAVIERTAHCNEADRLAAADEARQALAAQAADSVLENAARLEQIAEAIRDYHHALDLRKHGGLAESVAFNSICQTMGMPWNQGEEAARRAARKQGANHD